MPSGRTSLEVDYAALKRDLEEVTKFHSNLDVICDHPAYGKILALGKGVLPFILRDLEKGIDQDGFPGWWFMRAMVEISEEKPDMEDDVRHEDGFVKVSVEGVAKRWIEWGRKKGLIL